MGKENSLFTSHLTTRRYYYYCGFYGGLDLTKRLSISLFMFLLDHSPCSKISSLRSSFRVRLFLLEMSLLRLHFKITLWLNNTVLGYQCFCLYFEDYSTISGFQGCSLGEVLILVPWKLISPFSLDAFKIVSLSLAFCSFITMCISKLTVVLVDLRIHDLHQFWKNFCHPPTLFFS